LGVTSPGGDSVGAARTSADTSKLDALQKSGERPMQPPQPPAAQQQKPGSDGDGSNGSFYSRVYSLIPSPFRAVVAAVFTAAALKVFTPVFDEPYFSLCIMLSNGPAETTKWISREPVEEHFHAYLRASPGKVCIGAGPKGTGKSSAAKHAVRNLCGVAYVELKGEILTERLLTAVGMPRLERHTKADRPKLARMCEAAARWGRWWTGDEKWLPTLLGEVERNTEPGLVKDAVQTLKYLAHDAQACRAILVLSDASAALGLDPDPARRELIWLCDFSRAEADARLDLAKVLIGEGKLREEVFGMTTRPADLEGLCAELSDAQHDPSDLMVVRRFVEAKRAEAESRVTFLLSCDDSDTNKKKGLHFSHLLKDMVKNGGSLHHMKAPYMKPAVQVAPYFSVHDAIMYDLTTYEYRFNTPADMLAAAKLL
jgi:hypothetical protein